MDANSETHIRQAVKRDAESISAVLCASIRELCTADHGGDPETIARWTANKTPRHISRWISEPRHIIVVALRDGHPAGMGGMHDQGEILLNYVAPEHRFRGVSRAVLAHLERLLGERGVGTARLTSTATAHRFYRRRGWTDIGRPETVFGITGYPMIKRL